MIKYAITEANKIRIIRIASKGIEKIPVLENSEKSIWLVVLLRGNASDIAIIVTIAIRIINIPVRKSGFLFLT